ncbi:MAG: enoyl-CoA hydratase [Gammaproteobacteria bacterium]|nr:enoyl-CoA hydratase [Gammaproteobacteria bacterium]
MNRPESLNAFSDAMTSGLHEAIPRLAQDSNCRALMLTGAGRAFSAGGDVKGMAGGAATSGSNGETTQPVETPTVEQRAANLRKSTEICELLHTMPKPTIAAIPGVAAGGGLSVALSCDIRLASSKARFTTAFNKIGLSGDYGGTYFLTQLVGPAKARELYLASDIIDAEEAYRIGMVNHVFDAVAYDDEVMNFAQRLAAMPPISSGLMKENLNLALRGSLSDVLDLESSNIMTCFDSNDHKAGARAFVTKRPATFTGT